MMISDDAIDDIMGRSIRASALLCSEPASERTRNAVRDSAADVPALVAEVDRLRRQLRLIGESN